ncbi:PAS domain S-box protein [Massilia arenosa]|uniref:histidine kinase n=1 Tax=Zemynaea arenosa TaxID=2561931 RepID=A0A4Y9RT92_9BURK|nr:ATP-binding protein [Massilia arenosa]TFW11501.1 PAS domain S-box protein [Massilia arenosa]
MQALHFTADRRLGTYVALGFALLSALLTLILVEVIGAAASDQMRSQIGDQLEDLALQTADKLDRGMFERYREVRLMAARTDVTGADVSPAARRRALEMLQETYPYYAWIGLASRDGKVLSATKGMLEGVDVSQRPWFGNAHRGTYLGDVHEAKLLAKLLPNTSGEPIRFVDIAFPTPEESVLGVHLSWTWARDVERSVFRSADGRAIDAIIATRDGTVLLGPPALRDQRLDQQSLVAARTRSGSLTETWSDGRTYLVGFARSRGYESYPGLGWTVLVRQDVDTAFAPVTRIQRHVFWSGMLIAAGFSLFGLFAARRITRPIEDLANAAQRMQAGEDVPLPALNGGYREVTTLGASLQALLDDLHSRRNALAELNATLEERVRTRTQELDAALGEVRANEARIQTIIETAQDAYMATGLDGCVLEWNAAAERMFGWKRDEVIGKPLAPFIVPERFRARFDESLVELRGASVQAARVERVVMNREGEEYPVEATVSVVQSGGRTFFSAFVHDIRERKKVERMKNEFISTVSHELRTPLTSIRASLSLLASGMAGELPPDTKRLIEISNGSCERLVRLVNDVLDIEKIESGGVQLAISEQPLAPALQHALDALTGYAGQYQVALQLECPADLSARFDRDALQQVVTNLVSNAVKFSPSGGTVEVSAARVSGYTRIAVRDHGGGIPASFRDRVFQKFAQADGSDSRKRGGTGLGLAICRSLVELHGGRIRFETETGQGTTFYVELPEV